MIEIKTLTNNDFNEYKRLVRQSMKNSLKIHIIMIKQ